MAGKGSRQRTYGAQFESNYDRIFGKKQDTHADGADRSEAPDRLGEEWASEVDQYPREARDLAQKATEGRSEDVES